MNGALPEFAGTRPGLFRRLGVMAYDLLLILGLLMVGTALVLPFTGGTGAVTVGNFWFRLYLVTITVLFFAIFWTRGGQTAGMRAWHVRVTRADGAPLRLRDALLRYATSIMSWLPAGLGFLWVIVDRDHLAWHDRLSGTILTFDPPPKRRRKK